MRNQERTPLLPRLLAYLLCCLAFAAYGQSVGGEPVRIEAKRVTAPTFLLPDEVRWSPLLLATPEVASVAALHGYNRRAKRQQIGIAQGGARVTDLVWHSLPDGRLAARIAIRSPGAAALRVGLVSGQLPAGSELRVRGEGAVAEPTGVAGNAPDILWTAVTEGDTQQVEITLPPATAPAQAIDIAQVSHLITGARDGFLLPRDNRDIGAAGGCNVDVACATASSALSNTAAATAKMIFTDAGRTYRCSGTLLNDSDPATQVPYFISGNHCFDNELFDDNGNAIPGARNKTAAEMQAVASTLNTYWFFQAATCGARSVPSTTVQRTGGATLLYNAPQYDALLVRLNEAPPAGAWFSGWNADPVTGSLAVIGVHHPAGDLKKVSLGQVSPTPFRDILIYSAPDAVSLSEVTWNSGVTEGGSSGSGIFTLASGQYTLRGTLWGGASFCSSPREPDYYSRLDRYIGDIARYLAPGAGGVTVTPQTGWWWNPAEPGRGFFIELRGTQIFMSGYHYESDGRATWFIAQGPQRGNRFTADMLGLRGGQTLTGAYRAPGVPSTLGTVDITFADPASGTLIWPGGSTPISRYSFGGSGTPVPETGWWWASEESGRGYSIEVQGSTLFMVGFMYDAAGNPIWYSSSGQMSDAATYGGVWQELAFGQALTGGYRSPTFRDPRVGTVRVDFPSRRTANLTLPDGRVVPLTRFEF
jgi:hypothetical protein